MTCTEINIVTVMAVAAITVVLLSYVISKHRKK